MTPEQYLAQERSTLANLISTIFIDRASQVLRLLPYPQHGSEPPRHVEPLRGPDTLELRSIRSFRSQLLQREALQCGCHPGEPSRQYLPDPTYILVAPDQRIYYGMSEPFYNFLATGMREELFVMISCSEALQSILLILCRSEHTEQIR